MHLCSAEPANYAGVAAVNLGNAALSGSYTKADGDVSGRKTTCPAQTAVPISASGLGDHIVITNGVDTIVNITTCTEQAVTSGGTFDTPAWDHEIGDSV